MWIEAIITRDELVQALNELLPVKIHLDDNGKTERWLWLDRAAVVSLVPDEGLRVMCPAMLCWSIAGISPTVKIDALGIMVRPEIVEKDGQQVLEFKLELEEANFHALPAVVDSTVIKAVNSALSTKQPAWNFSKTLTHSVSMPGRLEPAETLKLTAAWGKRRISEEVLVLAVSIHLGFARGG